MKNILGVTLVLVALFVVSAPAQAYYYGGMPSYSYYPYQNQYQNQYQNNYYQQQQYSSYGYGNNYGYGGWSNGGGWAPMGGWY